MMSITKRGNGTWLVSKGSRHNRVRKVFKSYEEAVAFSKAEHKVAPRDITLEDLLRRARVLKWKDDSGVQADNARRCLEYFGNKCLVSSISRIKVNNFVEYLFKQGNSTSTVNRKLSALSVMLKLAEEEGYIPYSFRMPRQKEREGRKRVISKVDEEKIYKVCDAYGMTDLKDYIAFTLDTGFRKMEALNILKVDCCNGVATLHDGETKSGKGRRVPLTDRARKIVARRQGARVFEGMSEYSLRRDWELLRKALGEGEDFVIHSLRHTCATRLGEGGQSAMMIKEWLGHSSIVISQQYVHLDVSSLMEGARILGN